MSETKSRYYHLYANGKTVKEISQKTFSNMCIAGYERLNTWLLIAVHPKEIYVHKGKRGIIIQIEQLQQILGDPQK